MQRVSEFAFYELAVKVHQLTEIPDQLKYSAIWWTWWQAREALDAIYQQRPLSFTASTAYRLYQAISAVVPEAWDQTTTKLAPSERQDQEPDIFQWQIFGVREAAKEFETVLRNECQLMDTYFVSKKGVYSTKDLIEHAHHHIPEPCRSRLPEQTKSDFDQAGKCIAFDVPTAAAFHLLRGTEAVVRQYYEQVVPGPKQAPPKMRNWGTYIRLMKSHNANGDIILLLTHLKDVYRNPVLHPEENYTDERAQVLLGVCISAVVLMEDEIDKLGSTSGTLQFPQAVGDHD
jgi:hypothetical protein